MSQPEETKRPQSIRNKDFDPEDYRMTIGEHLEELRRRLILGLGGFALTLAACLAFGQRVIAAFCAPLINALQERDLNPQLYMNQISDGFMVFLSISLISALAISSPWIVYQLWLFVAAGLYPSERRYVTRFTPLSVGLLVSGMLFVYFLVLPWTVSFFLDFGTDIPLPISYNTGRTATTLPTTRLVIPILDGDPATPLVGEMWFNSHEKRLKILADAGGMRVVLFGSKKLLAPMITLPEYIDLVMGMLVVFGLSFQLPLVVMALGRVGIIDTATLRRARRYVYFAMAIVAATISPGDVVTITVALMIPLCLLYEFGIVLAGRARAVRDRDGRDSSDVSS